MKNKWRILKILVTVILLGFLLHFSLKRFAEKPLESISVNLKQTPVYFIDEKDILEIEKKYNPSRKIGDVDISALEKRLNSLPEVDSANVYLNLNGNLHLDIKQRVPIFRLNNGEKDFYVDEKGVEFPISQRYSYPCMLVTGNIYPKEYQPLARLVKKIDEDEFCKKYFIGISKDKDNYNLLTSEGFYKVELGDLGNINFKVKGFKAFVEKYLAYQEPEKYSKISLKYKNQIVTTLNPNFKGNDSIINSEKKELQKSPTVEPEKLTIDASQNTLKTSENPKTTEKKETPKPAENKSSKPLAEKKEIPKTTTKKLETKPAKKPIEKPKPKETAKKPATPAKPKKVIE
jgi:cell division protein FtsQ